MASLPISGPPGLSLHRSSAQLVVSDAILRFDVGHSTTFLSRWSLACRFNVASGSFHRLDIVRQAHRSAASVAILSERTSIRDLCNLPKESTTFMTPINRHFIARQLPPRIAAGMALVFVLHSLNPALVAQERKSGEHWVATWTTANLARPPQGNPPQAPPPGQPAAAAEPPLNFSNQTIRQIVRTSIGGERVRVVLANTFGTAPLAIGAARVALRDKRGGYRREVGPGADVRGRPDDLNPRRGGHRQRSGEPRGSATCRPRH